MKFASILTACVLLASAAAVPVSVRAAGWSAQGRDKPLKIISKPQAQASGCGGSGVVVVRATFERSGQVTEAEAIKQSGCQLFNQQAVRAARKIKFEPATRNGVPITVVKSVEYTYAVY